MSWTALVELKECIVSLCFLYKIDCCLEYEDRFRRFVLKNVYVVTVLPKVRKDRYNSCLPLLFDALLVLVNSCI